MDFDEFLEMMTGKMGDRDSKEEIMKVFALFDDDNTGKISFRNLKRVANELGEQLTDDELQEMIDEADRDGDGMINQGPFQLCLCLTVSWSLSCLLSSSYLFLSRLASSCLALCSLELFHLMNTEFRLLTLRFGSISFASYTSYLNPNPEP